MSLFKRRGLPRPIAWNPILGRNSPVAWSQDVSSDGSPLWGRIDIRCYEAINAGHCLLCGEYVEAGVVLVVAETALYTVPLREYYTPETIDVGVADNGVLHERCAKLTVAHCPFFKNAPANGEGHYVTRPFKRIAVP